MVLACCVCSTSFLMSMTHISAASLVAFSLCTTCCVSSSRLAVSPSCRHDTPRSVRHAHHIFQACMLTSIYHSLCLPGISSDGADLVSQLGRQSPHGAG